MPTLEITDRQAAYLNNLVRAAKYFREASKLLSSHALGDIEKMDEGWTPSGPRHQTMHEYTLHFGELNALLQTTWLIFDPSHLEGEARETFRSDVEEWVKLACGPKSEDFDLFFIAK